MVHLSLERTGFLKLSKSDPVQTISARQRGWGSTAETGQRECAEPCNLIPGHLAPHRRPRDRRPLDVQPALAARTLSRSISPAATPGRADKDTTHVSSKCCSKVASISSRVAFFFATGVRCLSGGHMTWARREQGRRLQRTNLAARPPRYVQDDIIIAPAARIGRGSASRRLATDGVECSLGGGKSAVPPIPRSRARSNCSFTQITCPVPRGLIQAVGQGQTRATQDPNEGSPGL